MPIESFSMLIDGQWQASADGSAFRCTSPFTAEDWAEVPAATADDVDAAVARRGELSRRARGRFRLRWCVRGCCVGSVT